MKTAIIGAGNVGASCAMRILEAGLADVVLLDILESLAKGKAEDLMDAASLIGHTRTITGTSDYKDIKGCDIVVITAGFARKPGMSREDLLNKNASIVRDVTKNLLANTKNPIIIVVTNPLDIMAYLVYKESGLSHKRVIGMAGALDVSRINLMTARQLNRPLRGISSMVLGTHGETMVPLPSQIQVDGKKIIDSADKKDIDAIIDKTKARGAEIVAYYGTGSAYYAPSAGVFRMVKAIIEDTKEMICCSCLMQGEYGIRDIYLGMPAILGKNGIEKVVEIDLTDEEMTRLKAAAGSVRKQVALLTLST